MALPYEIREAVVKVCGGGCGGSRASKMAGLANFSSGGRSC